MSHIYPDPVRPPCQACAMAKESLCSAGLRPPHTCQPTPPPIPQEVEDALRGLSIRDAQLLSTTDGWVTTILDHLAAATAELERLKKANQ